jgi:hypothetical protein
MQELDSLRAMEAITEEEYAENGGGSSQRSSQADSGARR